MTDTPELLLAHHLKTLKLPTFLREYDKLALPENLQCGGCESVRVKHGMSDHLLQMESQVWRPSDFRCQAALRIMLA